MSATFAGTRTRREFREALAAMGPHPPIASHSRRSIAEWYAENVHVRRDFVGGLAKIAWSYFGHQLAAPRLPVITANIVAGLEGRAIDVLVERLADYDADLNDMVKGCPFFGRVVYAGDRECVVTYCDSAVKRHGALQTTLEISGHEHHMVQVRERKVSDHDVHFPAKQRAILRMLPPAALPSVRVVQGMLVLAKEQEIATVSRDHAVGRRLRQAGAAVAKYGSSVAGGFAAGALVAGLGAAIVSVAQTAASVAVLAAADPAIVIGDLVISGWIEAEAHS